MSYVSENRRSSFTGMGAAILVNGSIILAVALSPLVVEPRMPDPIMIGRNIVDPPKPPPPTETREAKPIMPVFAPKPVIKNIIPPVGPIETTDVAQDTFSFGDGQGGDDVTETVREIIKPPTPLFKAAIRDPRFAQNFQPDYPVAMLRSEIEGSVTIRVLIGTDGRVRQALIVSATKPDFGRATERQAYKAWRFKPAMRDNEAVEDWQTLTVLFNID